MLIVGVMTSKLIVPSQLLALYLACMIICSIRLSHSFTSSQRTGREPDEHEGAAADAAGGRAHHGEAQRSGHGRVHGAAAVRGARRGRRPSSAATAPPPSRSATAGPRAAPVVRGDGAATIAEHVRPALALVVRGHGDVRGAQARA